MICQECGQQNATLHFTKIVNGEKTEFHICESCAREKGDMIPGTGNGFSIHNLLSGLMDFDLSTASGDQDTLKSRPQILRCENCGLTYTQFGKLGRFGCSSCYKYFSDRLNPIFKRVHGNTSHVGKIPKRAGGLIRYKRELEVLKRDLQKCIEDEEFEEAARLRDEIKVKEKELSGND